VIKWRQEPNDTKDIRIETKVNYTRELFSAHTDSVNRGEHDDANHEINRLASHIRGKPPPAATRLKEKWGVWMATDHKEESMKM